MTVRSDRVIYRSKGLVLTYKMEY